MFNSLFSSCTSVDVLFSNLMRLSKKEENLFHLRYGKLFKYLFTFWSSYPHNIQTNKHMRLKYLTKEKKKRSLTVLFFCILRIPTYYRSIFIALYMCILWTYFPLGWAFKLLYMLQKHVFAWFARAQLCINSFACKLLCRHSTLIAKVNSCINFNFCIATKMLFLYKIIGILKLLSHLCHAYICSYVGRKFVIKILVFCILLFFAPTLASTYTLDVRS